jgi:hypothetical protein
MLLLLVSYPLRLVLEPVDYGRHFKLVLRDVDPVEADIRWRGVIWWVRDWAVQWEIYGCMTCVV